MDTCNLYYLDLAYETLPEDVYAKGHMINIQIQYKKEIKYGEKVICKYAYKITTTWLQYMMKKEKIYMQLKSEKLLQLLEKAYNKNTAKKERRVGTHLF